MGSDVNTDFNRIHDDIRKKLNRTECVYRSSKKTALFKKRYQSVKQKAYCTKFGIIMHIGITTVNPKSKLRDEFRDKKVWEVNAKILTEEALTDWELLRAKAYRRDKGKCRRTNVFIELDNLEVHHMQPRCTGGKDTLSNIVCMTNEAHREHHKLHRYQTIKY